jgi:cytochrome P450
LREYDPADPAIAADPFPLFRELRAEDPVHYSETLGGWLLTRYADVLWALKEPRLSADRITPFMQVLPAEDAERFAELGRSLSLWAVFSDPPRHTRLRALFNKAFTPGEVQRLKAAITRITESLLAEVGKRGEFDLIQEFAYPLPVLVISEMLGVSADEYQRIKRWSDDVVTFIGLPRKPRSAYEAASESNHHLSTLLRQVISEHRRNPRENLLMSLINARDGADALSEDELVATAVLLVFAAHTNTTHLIGNGILALSRHAEEEERLRAQPELMASAVEEFLRYDGPVQAVRRVVLEDVTLAGKTLRKGELVFMLLNAANRDPAQFEEPESLVLSRRNNRHLAFGFGTHFCVGAALSRLEGQIAIPKVLEAFPRLRVVERPLTWSRSFAFRGLDSLPLWSP